MTLDLEHEELGATLSHLSHHLRGLLDAGAGRALELFADEVVLEHVLVACMRDEDCAAFQVVEHAFADPETVELELTALCPGTMVVGSDAVLPFSPRAVTALWSARGTAAASSAQVATGHVLEAALAELPEGARAELGAEEIAGAAIPAAAPDPSVPLFQNFSDDAKRALSQACKASRAARETNISPARLLVACLQVDRGLEGLLGVALARARARLGAHTVDAEPPPERRLPAADELVAHLRGLPEGADSLALLEAGQREGSQELRALLARHKITEALLQRSRGAFRDPEVRE